MDKVNPGNATLALRLNDAQRLDLDRPSAQSTVEQGSLRWASTLERTRVFHHAVRLPVAGQIVLNPSVSLRMLRAKLILEEFTELLDAMGLQLQMMTEDGPIEIANEDLMIEHIEGSRYDPVETADALGDLDVVVNGAGLSLGIPMNEVGYEIFCSNMTKLDEDGNPIMNQCQQSCDDDLDGPCKEPSHLQRPDLPVGKVLKPDHYTPANVTQVLMATAYHYGTED